MKSSYPHEKNKEAKVGTRNINHLVKSRLLGIKVGPFLKNVLLQVVYKDYSWPGVVSILPMDLDLSWHLYLLKKIPVFICCSFSIFN